MSAYAAYNGYPSFPFALDRVRLRALIGGAGDRPCIISAPSGAGKTISAAQFAASQELPTIWVSLAGQRPSLQRLMLSLRSCLAMADPHAQGDEALGELVRGTRLLLAERHPQGTLLVLDDVGTARASDAASFAAEVVACFRHLRMRVVLTTRQRAVLSGAMILDQHLLYFNETEVNEVAEAFDRCTVNSSTVTNALSACGGHPALTSILLAASDSHAGPPAAGRILEACVHDVSATFLDDSQRKLLDTLRVVRRASVTALTDAGFLAARRELGEITRVLPLVMLHDVDDDVVATSHDLICLEGDDWCQAIHGIGLPPIVLLRLLAKSGDADRLERALRASALRGPALDWLESVSTTDVTACLGREAALRVIQGLPLESVVTRSKIMLLWACVLYELGRIEDAASKAGVALSLARHELSEPLVAEAGAILVSALSFTNRSQTACEMSHELLSGPNALRETTSVCRVAASAALAAALQERPEEVESIRLRVANLDSRAPSVAKALRQIETTQAHLHGYLTSDWREVARRLMPLVNSDKSDDFTTRVKRRGNVSSCFVECGRLNRAEALLATILRRGDEFADGSYLPTLGIAMAGRGDLEAAIGFIKEGMRICSSSGDEMDYAHDLIYLATIERSYGRIEDSLVSAERAHEGCARHAFASLTELAAVEVGASLLALGDVWAARAWVEPVFPDLTLENSYEALSAAMVLAECDRRTQDAGLGIERLRRHSDQVRSENSNWKMAMYVRTFPHLLGMLAAAAGAKHLPVHMLRMVLPEHSEPALRAAESMLDPEEWRVLGRRLLGDEQFEDFVNRKGRPICRVRLLGSLDVCIDDRVVQERHWAKRKGRTIFAMLASRRGQELARDQILEHLWPDMDATRAKNNFYVAWSSMKAALRGPDGAAECPYVDNARGRCRIVRDWVRSDLDDFEELLGKARTAESEERPRDAIAAYSELMTVYRGDLLAGDLYDDWFAALREQYRVEFLDAMLRATNLLLEHDDPAEALMFARRGLAVDPFREDLYQEALRCHISAGQRSAAIETFLQCKAQLADELGLDPSSDTLKLYEQVLAMEERSRYDISTSGFMD